MDAGGAGDGDPREGALRGGGVTGALGGAHEVRGGAAQLAGFSHTEQVPEEGELLAAVVTVSGGGREVEGGGR